MSSFNLLTNWKRPNRLPESKHRQLAMALAVLVAGESTKTPWIIGNKSGLLGSGQKLWVLSPGKPHPDHRRALGSGFVEANVPLLGSIAVAAFLPRR